MTKGRVVVAGSINMHLVATTARHAAVGETVLGSDLQFIPGGKGANQAVAAARSFHPWRISLHADVARFRGRAASLFGHAGVLRRARLSPSPDPPTTG